MTQTLSRERVLSTIDDLFFSRKDVFARSFLKSDGTMGYSPACGCSPTCMRGSKCPNWQPLPVSDTVIYNHLKATDVRPRPQTIGSYGISAHDESRWIVLDVDAHGTDELDRACKELNAKRTIKLLSTTARDLNLPLYVEHSGGGLHAWIFAQTTAGVAHRAGKALVNRALEAYEQLPATVEVFPKQATNDAFGNLVKLPWGRHYTGRRTVFLDPASFEPLSDQWGPGGLLGFQRAPIATLEELAQEYKPLRLPLAMAPQERGSDELEMGPPCVAAMMNAQLGRGEGRNQTLFQLAVDLRRAGLVDIESVVLVLEPWNERQVEPLSQREFMQTVRSAFRGRYSYGCEKDYMQPYCNADRCPVFLGQQRRQQEPVQVSIPEPASDLEPAQPVQVGQSAGAQPLPAPRQEYRSAPDVQQYTKQTLYPRGFNFRMN